MSRPGTRLREPLAGPFARPGRSAPVAGRSSRNRPV